MTEFVLQRDLTYQPPKCHPNHQPQPRTTLSKIPLPAPQSSQSASPCIQARLYLPHQLPPPLPPLPLSHLRSNSNLLIKWSSWDCCNFRQVELCRPKSQFLFLVLQPVVKLSVFLRLMIIAMCAFYWPSNDFVHTWISLVGFAALPANVPVTFRVVWAPKGSLTAFLPHVLLFFLESGRDLP